MMTRYTIAKDYYFMIEQDMKMHSIGEKIFVFKLIFISFEQTINIDPNALYYNNRGNALKELKRYQEALTR